MAKQNTLEKSQSMKSFKAGTEDAVGIHGNLKTGLKPSRHEADRKREFAAYDTDTGNHFESREFARDTIMKKVSDTFTQSVAATTSENPRKTEEANLRDLIGESVSENTLKTYRGALRRLEAFMGIGAAGEVNVSLLLEKLDDATLARYIAALEAEGKAPATAQIAIAATSYAVKLRNTKSPVNRLTAAAMRGFRRKGANRGRGQARGVTWTQAETVVAKASKDPSLSGIRDAALISVMSDAMLRISEAAALLVSDITEETDGSGRLSIRRSKTDQEGRGAVLYLGHPTMVRVRAWREAGRVNDGALFRRVSRGKIHTSRVGETALSPLSIRRILKARAAQAGIEGVSGHSLRVGAAQSMASSGATLVDMQIAGRWQSPQMPALYARHQLAGSNAVARIRYGCK